MILARHVRGVGSGVWSVAAGVARHRVAIRTRSVLGRGPPTCERQRDRHHERIYPTWDPSMLRRQFGLVQVVSAPSRDPRPSRPPARCQWQPKSAHSIGEGRLGRSERSPGRNAPQGCEPGGLVGGHGRCAVPVAGRADAAVRRDVAGATWPEASEPQRDGHSPAPARQQRRDGEASCGTGWAIDDALFLDPGVDSGAYHDANAAK